MCAGLRVRQCPDDQNNDIARKIKIITRTAGMISLLEKKKGAEAPHVNPYHFTDGMVSLFVTFRLESLTEQFAILPNLKRLQVSPNLMTQAPERPPVQFERNATGIRAETG